MNCTSSDKREKLTRKIQDFGNMWAAIGSGIIASSASIFAKLASNVSPKTGGLVYTILCSNLRVEPDECESDDLFVKARFFKVYYFMNIFRLYSS